MNSLYISKINERLGEILVFAEEVDYPDKNGADLIAWFPHENAEAIELLYPASYPNKSVVFQNSAEGRKELEEFIENLHGEIEAFAEAPKK